MDKFEKMVNGVIFYIALTALLFFIALITGNKTLGFIANMLFIGLLIGGFIAVVING